MSEDDILDRTNDVAEAQLAKDDDKREKKRLRKLEEAMETGSLEPWERYRVLTDLLDHFQDIAEMADRKSRFALVVLGAVNAVNLLVVARPAVLSAEATVMPALGIYVAIYIALSLFLFVQAIGALKPRISIVLSKVETPAGSTRPVLGLRFVKNILDSSFEEYYQKWKGAQFVDINRDLALHVQHLAAIVTAKYVTLHRLYSGLMVLVFLTAGLVAFLAFGRLRP
jgi:hypothetical protein